MSYYTLEIIGMPDKVETGEPFDVNIRGECIGESQCPRAEYTLTIGGADVVTDDWELGGGGWATSAPSAEGISLNQTGTYTVIASVGNATVSDTIEVVEGDGYSTGGDTTNGQTQREQGSGMNSVLIAGAGVAAAYYALRNL